MTDQPRIFCKECELWTNDLAHPLVPSCPLAPPIRARKPTAKRLRKFLEDVRDLAKTEVTTERVSCSPGSGISIAKGGCGRGPATHPTSRLASSSCLIRGGRWHAMERLGTSDYRSLCGAVQDGIAHGSLVTRPPPILRCGACDGLEMGTAGAEESLPETDGWRRARALASS